MSPDALHISLEQVGKRHGRQWILRHIHDEIEPGQFLALLGTNGSGKSSLLRIMCGFDRPSEGVIRWRTRDKEWNAMELPLSISYCAPDQGLIPDLTVAEHLALHQRLRQPLNNIGVKEGLEWAQLETKGSVRVRDLSSGMRQRLALTLAMSSAGNAIFLDEPTSHLDSAGRKWYSELLETHRKGRTVVVASNHNPTEFPGAHRTVELSTP